MQKIEVRKKLDAYLATRLEDDQTFEDVFWQTCYPDDIPYEVSEVLDYMWLPFEAKSSGWEWDYYVEVFWYLHYIRRWILLDNSKPVELFVFNNENELVDWIDEMQDIFITIEEELKAHYLQ